MTGLGWRGAWKLARRDLSGGFRGLRLLFICLFLGVTTLATIGSLTAAIQNELSVNGQAFLGGDLEVEISQREATGVEKAALAREGRLSETVRTQAMARRGDEQGVGVLTELKAVDRNYPLFGEFKVQGAGLPLGPADALIGPGLAERLALKIGDRVRYGEANFLVRGIISDEPDRVSEGFTLGPVAIVSLEGLRRTRLIAPGSLFQSKYRIRLAEGGEPEPVIERLQGRFENQGWEFQSRNGAAPGASRFFDRMGQFLSLIGLAALVIAGIGVGNGVTSYLAGKRNGTATLKILGATSQDIGRIYFLEIGIVAAAAVGLGLIAGAVLPLLAISVAGDLLPVQPRFAIHPVPLATSAEYGLLIAFIFALPPLARARLYPAASQFRALVDERRRIDIGTVLVIGAALVLLVATALVSSDNPGFVGMFMGAVVAALILLAAVGSLLRWAARRLPRVRRPLLRTAISNLHRPGSQTVALVIALGLSLTLFVTISAIQTSLRAEIEGSVPKRAPDQFVLDIPAPQRPRFEQVVRRHAPGAALNVVPTLRGTITAYGGTRVSDLEELPEGAWFLRGDRGVTYSADLPESSELVEGSWWPSGYSGPPLVSIDVEAARIMGVGVGDTMTVSILGREIEARIASLRKVNWRSLGFNYILVFSPNSLAGAPHTVAGTISMDGPPSSALNRDLLTAFPFASVIDVGELIGRIQAMLGQMAAAILIAASVTVLAGIAVLVGAIAASRHARSYDSVIIKVLGGTRLQILGSQAIEYAMLAAVLSAFALAIGLYAAHYVVVQLFEFGWAPHWPTVLLTLGAGSVLTLVIGLLGSLPLMAVRPAAALRTA
ncbi:ABC transporter permease [Sphingomonas piscis]|uniref:ABC transporter permease n=1 Tax=Sphingomonas piscis TaxID=2714943 RepID=A0A6G7YN55_9SPHN|nr:ABC transporter permease [Sphingomonas piscis]QIK78172.1 ABC transporter permease [Sphingomonas piscis]